MQKISSFCEDKVFFQTPFFTDLLKLCCCCATVPCSVLSHLRFMQFHKLFQNLLKFCLLASQVTSFMFIWKCIGQKIMNWNGDFYMRGTLVTFRIIWSTSKRERDAKSYFPSDDHRSPFLLPRLSSEPMIISEITAKHKKAIRWDHHQALRLGNQNSHQPFMKYLLYSNGIMRSKMWSLIPLKGTNKVF